MDTIGIDIGTTSVKYLRWRGRKGRGAAVSQGEYPYEGTWESLEEVVAGLSAGEGTKVTVSISITSQNIIKKVFTIPVLPRKEVREALNWSASKIVATPLDEMNHEYIMLGAVSEKGIQKEEVLFVGVAKAYIDRMISVFRRVGFSSLAVITDLGACFLPIVEKISGASVSVLDVGGKQTGIYIFDGRKARLVREINTASESFTEALMAGLGLTHDEAETYKIEKGFDDGSREALFIPMERLAGEARRTFKVYNQKYPDRQIAKVCITGRGARFPNFVETLKYHLGEDVEPLRAPAAVDDAYIPAYMAAARKEQLLNLLPEDEKSRRKEMEYGRWARIGAVAVASVLIVLSLNTMAHFNRVKDDVELEKRTLAEKQAGVAAVKQTLSGSRYDELVGAQRDLEEKRAVFLAILKYFSAHIPQEIYLQDIEFGPKPTADSSKAGPTKPDARKPPSPARDEKSPQETVKDGAKGSLVKTGGGVPDKSDEDPFRIRVRGYVFGEPDTWEPALADLLIRMEQSRVFSAIQVSGRAAKELRGRHVMEFSLTARCKGHGI